MKLIRLRHILQTGLLMFSITIQVINSELFTSIAEMEDLLETQSVLITNLQGYIDAQQTQIDYIQKKVYEYRKEHAEAAADIPMYLSNPINAYLLTKRLTLEWKQLENLMSHNLGNEFLENITNHHHVLKFPSDGDLKGAADALMRLQVTYNLQTENVAKGELNGVQYSTEMASNDCFELGRQSYINGNYYLAISWMREAMDRQIKEASNQTLSISRADILLYLAISAYKQGNASSALTTMNQLLELAHNDGHVLENIQRKYAKEISEITDSKLKGDNGSDEIDVAEIPIRIDSDPFAYEVKTYEKLCRLEIQPTPEQLRPLRCRYVDNNMSYLKIAPFKIEEVSMSPYIVVFHEVMYDNEIEVVKKMAKPRFTPAALVNPETGELEVTYSRTGKAGWLQYEDHKYIARIGRRVQDMTRLDMETAEDLQVVNYGIGGHYVAHVDFGRNEEENTNFSKGGIGNRIATVLFYMSDVEQGGATVFPHLRTAIRPKKGTALFWFNFLSSGEGDYRTLHAACPVLTGSKWISTVWLHERGQEFIRKCDLQAEPALSLLKTTLMV